MGIFTIENKIYSKRIQKTPCKQSRLDVKHSLWEPKAERSLTRQSK